MVSATPTDPQVTAAQAAGPIWLRLTKSGNTYSGAVQVHGGPGRGTPFSGTVTNAMVAPKFGLYTQGVLQSGDTVTFEYFSVDGDSTGCPPTENDRPVDRVRDGDADVRLRAADRRVRRRGL